MLGVHSNSRGSILVLPPERRRDEVTSTAEVLNHSCRHHLSSAGRWTCAMHYGAFIMHSALCILLTGLP